MINIIPGILTSDSKFLQTEIERFKNLFTEIQIDLTDGFFTDRKTIQSQQIEALSSDLVFGFHLMVKDPLNYLEDAIRLKISHVIIHAEIEGEKKTIIDSFHSSKIKCGLAVNPDTTIDSLGSYIEETDFVQIMGVAPGEQGRAFQPIVLEKVSYLRKNNFQKPIWLDGGVNDKTIGFLKGFDLQSIVVGSFLKEGDLNKKLAILQEALK